MNLQPAVVYYLLLSIGVSGYCVRAVGDEEKPPIKTDGTQREQIGTVAGKPVYRDQIRTKTKGFELRDELHRLFAAASVETFRKENAKAVAPTADEIQKTTDNLFRRIKKQLAGEYGHGLRSILAAKEKELESPGLSDKERQMLQLHIKGTRQMLHPSKERLTSTAEWMLKNWKLHRQVYDKYGGRRVVWQQAGVEAFNAMHNFYKQRESAGDFQITDPELKTVFYECFTNEKMHRNGAFLTGDKEKNQSTLLTPL